MKRNVLSLAPVVGNCYKFQSLPSHLLASRSSRRSTKTLTFGFSFTYQGWNNFPLAILRITKTIMRNICLPPGLSKDMDMTHGREEDLPLHMPRETLSPLFGSPTRKHFRKRKREDSQQARPRQRMAGTHQGKCAPRILGYS
jgi:hypothetical protein